MALTRFEEEDIQNALDVMIELQKQLSENDDFISSKGLYIKKMYEEYLHRGFTRVEAIEFIKAELSAPKK